MQEGMPGSRTSVSGRPLCEERCDLIPEGTREEDAEVTNYFGRLAAQTPSRAWVNNPTEAEIGLALEHGAVGSTTNPHRHPGRPS